MTCPICGPARGCLACRVEGRIRYLVETDDGYRARVAELWREGTADGSAPSPRENRWLPTILANACDHSAGRPESCGCADKRVCLAGYGRGPGGGHGHEVYFLECLDCPLGAPVAG